MRKYMIQICLSISVIISLLTACGGEYIKETGNRNVSGSVISGSAVSGQAVSSSAIDKQRLSEDKVTTATADKIDYPYSTPKKLYMEDIDFEYGGFFQMNHDGTEKKLIEREDYMGLVKVDETGVYYMKEGENGPEKICWIPIKNEKEELDIECEETILIEKDGFMGSILSKIYIDEEKIIYVNGAGELVWYDCQKKCKIPLKEKLPEEDIYIMAEFDNILILECFQESEDGEGLDYSVYLWLDLKTGKCEQFDRGIYDGDLHGDNIATERYFYYYTDGEIHQFDAETRLKTDFLSWKELEKTLFGSENKTDSEVEFGYIKSFFWDKGTVYIYISEAEESIYSKKSAEAPMTYEKELTLCMKNEFSATNGSVQVGYLVSGKMIYIQYTDVEGKINIGYYDLRKKKFKMSNQKDTAYYAPFRVSTDPYDEDIYY